MLESWYYAFFLWINASSEAHPYVIRFAVLVADYLTGIMLAVLLLCMLAGIRFRRSFWLGLLATVALAMLATYLLRKGINVPRPFTLGIGTQAMEHSASSSFPSKHATPLFAVAMYLLLGTAAKKWAGLWLAGTLLVAWSRVYLGVHWPTDMLGACLVGLLSAWAVQKYLRTRQKMQTER